VRLVLCSFFALRGNGSVQFGLICRQHFVARSWAPNLGSPHRKENRSFDNAFCPDLHTRIGAVLWVKQLVVGVVPRPGLPPPPAFDRCGQASFAIPDSPGSALSWLAPHIALLLPDIPVSLFSLLIVSIPQWTPSGKSNIDVQQSEQSNLINRLLSGHGQPVVLAKALQSWRRSSRMLPSVIGGPGSWRCFAILASALR